jgi:hypothetical protein
VHGDERVEVSETSDGRVDETCRGARVRQVGAHVLHLDPPSTHLVDECVGPSDVSAPVLLLVVR